MKTKILMLGWELPPQISGGLGVACEGLLKGLKALGRTETMFIVPHVNGQEDGTLARVIGMSADASHQRNSPIKHVLQDSSGWGDGLLELAAVRHLQGADRSRHHAGNPEVRRMNGAYDVRTVTDVYRYRDLVKQALPDLACPDVIHAHDWLTFPGAIEAKLHFGRPLFVHMHSTEFDRGGVKPNSAILDIEEEGLRYADKVFAVSETTRQMVIGKYGIAPEQVVVVHNGTDFLPQERLLQHQPDRQATVSFIGRITHQKGPRYFIEAAQIVLSSFPDTRFVMAGTGDLLPMAKSLASVLGVRKQFEFPGFLNSQGVAALLARSDVYVMPSVSEPFGIGALEAMLAGVPTIITNCCGASEVVDDVMSVPSGDASAIAEAIVACLSDRETAARRAMKAKASAQEMTWDRTARRVVAEYARVTNV